MIEVYQKKILVRICLYCFKCTKFGQLILRRIIKIVATRCQILRLKMHQIRFRLGLCPTPHWGRLQRYPDPQLYLRGLLLRGGRGWKGKGQEKRGVGSERGTGQEGRVKTCCPISNKLSPPMVTVTGDGVWCAAH